MFNSNEKLYAHMIFRLPDGREVIAFGSTSYILSENQAKIIRKYRRLAGSGVDKSQLKDILGYNKFLSSVKNAGWVSSGNFKPHVLSVNDIVLSISNAMSIWQPLIFKSNVVRVALQDKPKAYRFLIEKLWLVWKLPSTIRIAADTLGPEHPCYSLTQDFYDTEKNHYKALLQDISLSQKDIESHSPSCYGKMLVGYLYEMAQSRPLSYLISISLLEAKSADKQKVMRLYSGFEDLLGVKLNGFKDHFLDDLACNHASIWKSVLSCGLVFTPNEVSSWVDDLHATRHILVEYQKNISDELLKINSEIYVDETLIAKTMIKSKQTVYDFLFKGKTL